MASLEGQLKTATAHAESHRVHVDVISKRGASLRL
jgi:hypothetical protein